MIHLIGAVHWLVNIGRYASTATLIAMAGLICFEVLARSALGFSTLIADEMAGYMLLAITYLGAAHALRTGAMLQVSALLSRMPRGWQTGLMLVFDFLAFVFSVIVTYYFYRSMMSSYRFGVQANTLMATPLWIPQVVMVFGMALLSLQLLSDFTARALGLAGRSPAHPPGEDLSR